MPRRILPRLDYPKLAVQMYTQGIPVTEIIEFLDVSESYVYLHLNKAKVLPARQSITADSTILII